MKPAWGLSASDWSYGFVTARVSVSLLPKFQQYGFNIWNAEWDMIASKGGFFPPLIHRSR
jgi:hypothetical protein